MWQCGIVKPFLCLLLSLALPVSAAEPAAVVTAFYKTIVADKPLGIPEGKTKAALWPLMTPGLKKLLERVSACEADYIRKHAGSDEKPEYWWLETGLFSGHNEMALPSAFEIVNTESLGGNRHRVTVRFTYHDQPGEGQLADPAASFQWRSALVVACSQQQCLVDDFIPFDIDTAKPLQPLSESFGSCKGARWVGN
jgi:hypothetical protein